MSMLIVSCGNSNPLTGKKYFGEIIRVKDSRVLSPIVLDFNGKNLKVYANAIFGSTRTDFTLNSENDNQYFYANKEKSIFLLIKINQDNSITINSNQCGTFYANAIVDEAQSKTFIDNQYDNKKKSFNPDNYLTGASYEGFLYRKSDSIKLSKIVLLENNDTIKVFSNAIFGANNIILNNVDYNEELDCFKYNTNELNDISVYSFDNKLKFEGNDFYAVLEPKKSSKIDCSFYIYKKVSNNPSHYPIPGNIYSGNLTSTKREMAEAMTMYTFNATVSFIDESNMTFNLKAGINKDYLRLYSMATGANYNIGKMLFGTLDSNETTNLKYYIDEEGAIIAEDKINKTKDKYFLSEHNTVLMWEDKASGFKGELKLK